ncbi:hypothetical protein XdyCFBP7245_17390 [Xanthomonas dyei]|uniref:Secreted protein n=2 Tax=Xanthomonas dyei TaxID=743699 RepID=A0A2S7BZ53_9XANT|nr:hypothetical protein [Xanthomonas dyei]PPU54616.1 hypothetical protein XdyCFBP7245_17390 [Xanthomonas dyei]
MENVFNKLTRLLVLSLASAVPAMAAEPASSPTDGASARIRMFGQNGIGIVLYKDAVCTATYGEKVRASGSLKSAFGSLMGSVKNESIGIPETENTRHLRDRKMIGSKPFYKEYAIEPGKPVVVEAGASSPAHWSQSPGYHIGWSCGALLASTFVPEPGADYEVALNLDFRSSVCTLAVNRVDANGQVSPVDVAPVAKDCK